MTLMLLSMLCRNSDPAPRLFSGAWGLPPGEHNTEAA